MSELKGKVALVTGGARGLGREICQDLAEAGARVICCDVREELAAETVEAIRATGGDARAVSLDVSDEEQVAKVCGEVAEQEGRLDVVVNNAGVDYTEPVSDLTAEKWDHVIGVNLRGPFLMSKYGMRHMADGGHIVNIASTAGKRAWPNASAYHASKWGLLGFTHALHTEARQQGVKVTAVVTGGMRTPFLFDRFPELDPELLQDPAKVARVVRFVLTQPEESVIPEVMVLPMRETSWP